MRIVYPVAATAALLFAATPAWALVADPTGDFLSSYTGPQNADVDILTGSVLFDGSSFAFSETTNGLIGGTTGALYVWAVNRGSGVARPLQAPPDGASILWDAAVVMFPDGTLRVVNFNAGSPPTLTNIVGGTLVSGNSLSGSVPLNLLSSTGFNPADYTFSLWSRVRVNPAADGANSEVADLLAGSGMLRAVPEPQSWAMMLIGFAAIGSAMRFRRARAVHA